MRVLLLGASGFLGGAMAAALANAGHSVRCHAGPPGVAAPELCGPPAPALAEPALAGEAVWFDLCDAGPVAQACSGVDVVVHAAGPASVVESFRDPAACARAHVVGMAVLVRAMAEAGVARLVHVSSAEIYGRPQTQPVGEDAPVRPRSPYGAAKAGAEAMALAATTSHGLGCIALRPFSVYGPRQSRAGVFEAILRQAAAAPRVELDDLSPVRDWCSVADVARAACLAVHAVEPRAFRAYNVASGQGTSVAELAERVVRAFGRQVAVVARAVPQRPAQADILHLVADIARIRSELGWQPTTGLDTGIAETVSWFRSRTATA